MASVTAAQSSKAKVAPPNSRVADTSGSQNIATLRKQAEGGDASAQAALGEAYYLDLDGVSQNYKQAIIWLRKAAAQDNAMGEYILAGAYVDGHGVPQDYTQAAIWFRKAAKQGYALAEGMLGAMYSHGQGVPQDYAQAAIWYRKAAEQGLVLSQEDLGWAYAHGQGVPQDYIQAVTWFRKAAMQGDTDAQAALGVSYVLGKGVPQDYSEAYFWLDLAAAGKLDSFDRNKVPKFRDEAASHLTPGELSRVQERARKWFESHPKPPQR